jgi:hypothetical protein
VPRFLRGPESLGGRVVNEHCQARSTSGGVGRRDAAVRF